MKAEKTRAMLDEFLKLRLIAKDGIVNTVILAEIEELERLATLYELKQKEDKQCL